MKKIFSPAVLIITQDISPEISAYLIPKITLQQPVENSICHAFQKWKSCSPRSEIVSIKKKQLIQGLCIGQSVSSQKLSHTFPDKAYHMALVRYGGLPLRFSTFKACEIFSDSVEQIFTYGRDDREALYICSDYLLDASEFVQAIQRKIKKGTEESLYYTLLFSDIPVTPKDFPQAANALYQSLLHHTTVGKNTILFLPELKPYPPKAVGGECPYLSLFEKYCAEGNLSQIRRELLRLLDLWTSLEYTQLKMEQSLHHIHYVLQKYHLSRPESNSQEELLLSEAFYNSENVEQLSDYILEIFLPPLPSSPMEKLDSQEYYQKVIHYINQHFREPLTLQSTCKTLGVSQAYLSMIIRKYGSETFKSYVTKTRIACAKKLMTESQNKVKLKDIAEQSGFHDQFQFSKIFHSYTGVSPSDYLDSLSSPSV